MIKYDLRTCFLYSTCVKFEVYKTEDNEHMYVRCNTCINFQISYTNIYFEIVIYVLQVVKKEKERWVDS